MYCCVWLEGDEDGGVGLGVGPFTVFERWD